MAIKRFKALSINVGPFNVNTSYFRMLPVFHQLLLEQNRRNIHRLRLRRSQLRNEADPFNLPNRRFIQLYRLDKVAVRRLVNILTPYLRSPLIRGAISKELKIFCALRFYATGSYQRSVGEEGTINLSQTVVHRAVHEVTHAIVQSMAAEYIKFPITLEERNRIKGHFMEKWNFPGVIGAIDCTHIAILKPQEDEHNFINRKGYHSLNCQIICDDTLRIINIFANYGGATHDSFIWRHSSIKDYMETLYANGESSWLIGDSGYPLQPFMMTPFHNPPEGSPQARFNHAHIRARNCVERCIGLLKMRFRCVLKERSLRYAPQFVANLLKACSTLHNICIAEGIPLVIDEIEDNLQREMEIPLQNEPAQLAPQGLHVRDRIIEQYYQ